MEKGERVVTSDELAAFAVAFGVSPAALLLPLTAKPDDDVEVTGGGSATARQAWLWASSVQPLRTTAGNEQTERLEHQLYSLPPWLRSDQNVSGWALFADPRVGKLLEQLMREDREQGEGGSGG